MEFEAKRHKSRVLVDVKIPVIVDGTAKPLTLKFEWEVGLLGTEVSIARETASAASLALNKALRELHTEILPQLRGGLALVVDRLCPPARPDGVGSASGEGAAISVAGTAPPHPETSGGDGDDSKAE